MNKLIRHDLTKGNLWFTADPHFGHDAIRKHCKRPYQSLQEMDDGMIKNWNDKVGNHDTIAVLGDFAFKDYAKYLDRLNGAKIYLVFGNHDNYQEANKVDPKYGFTDIQENLSVMVDHEEIFLSHFAHRVWNKSHYGTWHLYGHTHGMLPEDELSLSFDVGVDCNNFTPVSYQQVKDKIEKKKAAIIAKYPDYFNSRTGALRILPIFREPDQVWITKFNWDKKDLEQKPE